ncbi:MAG: sigma-70 family RNA polymerase sigma factor [Pirellulaceae bacterium]|nr:sigma-70 family RNA polymerase sigma factor [Pirellulaceae bacterium]
MSLFTNPQLFQRAIEGESEALGELLEKYRPFLRLLAERRLDHRVKNRVDASDVIQLTFLDVQRDLKQFQGKQEPELIGWIKKILENNLNQMVRRHVATQKRSAMKENRLDNSTASGRVMRNQLPGEFSSPSQRVMRGEAALRLAKELDKLPTSQHHALRLRYLEGYSLAEIAQAMEKSQLAVAGLLKRGLQNLRKQFSEI